MPLGAGAFNRIINIYNNSATVDGATGDRTRGLVSVASGVRACISPVSERTAEIAKSISSSVSVLITVRYRKDVLPQQIIESEGTYYTIEGMNNPDRNKRELVLGCSAIVV